MDNLIEDVFNQILVEAEEGIKYENMDIKFHTLEKYTLNSSYNDFIPVLIINNKKELINKLKQYVELVIKIKKLETNKNSIKKCIISLLSNACYEDFSNPTRFVDNHISFYINNDFMSHELVNGNIRMKRVTQPIYKETPYAFKACIKEKDECYYLPNISYGISGDICYIYKMEQTTKNKNNEYNKNIENKYDTNILTISLFLKELSSYGISKVKVVSCLPMRLESNEQISSLLDNFTSLNYTFNNIIILSDPFEQDEYMNIEIKAFDVENSSSLNELLMNDSKVYE